MQTQEPNQNATTSETEKKSLNAKCCGIYGLRNKTNGKWYVGQSKRSIHSRWVEYKNVHRNKGQVKLYKALRKYGYDGFEKIILEECLPEQAILDAREDYWIRFYDSVENGYNCRYGGSNGTMSDEVKRKHREWHAIPENKQMVSSRLKSYIAENGHPWKGKTHRDDSKLKMAAHDRSGNNSPSFGKIWINNGIESKKIPSQTPMPDGFVRGRLFGTVWINNGRERKFIKKDAALPVGFVYGKLYHRKHSLIQ